MSNSCQLSLITREATTADSTVSAKVLDVHWHTDADKLSFIPKTTTLAADYIPSMKSFKIHRRCFDPLGLAVPVTIHAKFLIQTRAETVGMG